MPDPNSMFKSDYQPYKQRELDKNEDEEDEKELEEEEREE